MSASARAGAALAAILTFGAAGQVSGPGAQSAGPRFVTHTIAAELSGGYQPIVVDLNRDGRPDVIGLSTRLDELAWFENPGWERHVLTTGLNRAINLAARDLDDDGIPELVVAHEFGTSHGASLGILSLLTHQGDPTRPWTVREIDRTPTAHRLRWADIDGDGRDAVVTGDRGDVRSLYLYTATDAEGADWSRQIIDDGGMSPSGCAPRPRSDCSGSTSAFRCHAPAMTRSRAGSSRSGRRSSSP